ncbi:hypothetical protein, partial [Streptomyces sp. SID10815]|uniref:hypothetical protein n=1 Tax=Streptomyces sp. SID10815 TaxID=2706027 RepID=UPI001941C6E3
MATRHAARDWRDRTADSDRGRCPARRHRVGVRRLLAAVRVRRRVGVGFRAGLRFLVALALGARHSPRV